jgi:hypothetical protein
VTLIPIEVSDSRRVVDLDVAIFIEHPWTADLDISLVSPAGTSIDLSTDNGFFVDQDPRMPPMGWARQDFGTPDRWARFDDESIALSVDVTQMFSENIPFHLPFAGSYSPEQSLEVYDGQSGLGTWTLRIVDDSARDVGAILNAALIFSVMAPLPCDFNGDGSVDAADLLILRSNFGTGTTFAQGDGDADGDVDGADLLAWQRHCAIAGADTRTGAVPEPDAAWLSAIAALGVVNRRRKARSR